MWNKQGIAEAAEQSQSLCCLRDLVFKNRICIIQFAIGNPQSAMPGGRIGVVLPPSAALLAIEFNDFADFSESSQADLVDTRPQVLIQGGTGHALRIGPRQSKCSSIQYLPNASPQGSTDVFPPILLSDLQFVHRPGPCGQLRWKLGRESRHAACCRMALAERGAQLQQVDCRGS